MKLSLFVFLLLFGRGNVRELPRWVLTPEKIYPSDLYIYAIGTGGSVEEARQSALSSLITSIYSKISGVQCYVEEKKEISNKPGKSNITSVGQFKLDVVSTVEDLPILGVYFPEFYYDDSTKGYYTIAVLDRLKSSALYTSEIARINGEIEELMNIYETTNDPFKKRKAVNKAYKRALQREKLKIVLFYLNPKLIEEEKYRTAYLSELEENIRSNLVFSLKCQSVGNKFEQLVFSLLSNFISQSGFKVIEEQEGKEAPNVIRISFSVLDMVPCGKYFCTNWMLKIVIELQTGLSREFTYSHRSVSLSESMSENILFRDVKSLVESKVLGDIRAFLEIDDE